MQDFSLSGMVNYQYSAKSTLHCEQPVLERPVQITHYIADVSSTQ